MSHAQTSAECRLVACCDRTVTRWRSVVSFRHAGWAIRFKRRILQNLQLASSYEVTITKTIARARKRLRTTQPDWLCIAKVSTDLSASAPQFDNELAIVSISLTQPAVGSISPFETPQKPRTIEL